MSLEAAIVDDGDGNPANDSVMLLGVGTQGEAQYSLELTLDAMSDNGGLTISPGSGQRVSS